MDVERSIEITAPPEAIWAVISDIPNSASVVGGIDRIEVLEPATGPSIVGLKWRETRVWRGQEATEVMWITDAEEASHYTTRSESNGSIYASHLSLEPTSTGTRLTMAFNARPMTALAKVIWALTGWMAKRALGSTIEQDLTDLKAAAQGANRGSGATG